MTTAIYRPRCPLSSCRKRLGDWTSLEMATSRLFEHLETAHNTAAIAVVALEREGP